MNRHQISSAMDLEKRAARIIFKMQKDRKILVGFFLRSDYLENYFPTTWYGMGWDGMGSFLCESAKM